MNGYRALTLLPVIALIACGEDEPTGTESNPPPSLYSLDPAAVLVGSGDFTLDLHGADFVRDSRVRWNGQDRPTTFVNDSLLSALIAATYVDSTGTAEITVQSPPPGGGLSGFLEFMIVNPGPTITGLAPTSVVALADSLTLLVSGTGFIAGSQVSFGGSGVPTTLEESGELRVRIPGFLLRTPRIVEVVVANPAPGGGISAPEEFSVEYPTPVVTGLSPDSGFTGHGFTLTVFGEKFMPQASVRWDDSARPTAYLSSTRVEAEISSTDVATSGTFTVTVAHPEPGGGSSAGIPFRVRQAPPRIASTSPSSVTAGAGPFTLTVNGTDFHTGAIVQWNGAARTTNRVSASTVRAEIPAADVADAGTAEVTVVNPGESGASAPFAFPILAPSPTISSQIIVELAANHIVYDPVRQRIWASVPGSDPQRGNTVTAVDPESGTLLESIAVGSEPGPLAISHDGTYLYVGLGGAPTIVRVDLAAGVRDIDIDLGSGSLGGLRAEDLVALPGLPRTVAVSRRNTCCSPRHEGVAIYDDATRRSATTQGHTGSNRITRSATGSRLYGYNNETTEFGFRTIAVTPTGLVEETVRGGLISGFGVDIEYDGGLVYATTGALVDPEALSLIGTFPASGLVRPDAANGRVHFFAGSTLRTYQYRTFDFIGSFDIFDASGAGTMIRWASDGLAFRTESRIVIVRGTLVGNP